jgi:hypothetical protein
VRGLGGTARVPAGTYRGVLLVGVRSRLAPGSVSRLYARGIGLVEESADGPGDRSVLLTGHTD